MATTTLLLAPKAPAPWAVGIADGFWSRFKGLMFAAPLAPGRGLLLLDCTSVHSAFMRQSIDVVYLDAAGGVTRCVSRLAPWRASWGARGTRHTLELAAGTLERLALARGDRLRWLDAHAPRAWGRA